MTMRKSAAKARVARHDPVADMGLRLEVNDAVEHALSVCDVVGVFEVQGAQPGTYVFRLATWDLDVTERHAKMAWLEGDAIGEARLIATVVVRYQPDAVVDLGSFMSRVLDGEDRPVSEWERQPLWGRDRRWVLESVGEWPCLRGGDGGLEPILGSSNGTGIEEDLWQF